MGRYSQAWFCLVALMVGCAEPSASQQEAPIVDGSSTEAYPAVGALYNTHSKSLCTATRIAPGWLLTAAHCLNENLRDLEPNPVEAWRVSFSADFEVLVGDLDVRAEEVFVHPGYAGGGKFDVGLVRLDDEDEGAVLPLTTTAPYIGEPITLLGYGATSRTASDAGRKRVADNDVAGVSGRVFTYEGTGDGEGNVCEGDSGGPTLAERDSGVEVIGVHSYRSGSRCGTSGTDMRVEMVLGWVLSVTELTVDDVSPPIEEGDGGEEP